MKRLDEVSTQLEVVRDLQRQFASFSQEVRERGREGVGGRRGWREGGRTRRQL